MPTLVIANSKLRKAEMYMTDRYRIREMDLEADLQQVCEIWLNGIKETAPPLTSGDSWESLRDSFIKETQAANERYVYEENGTIRGFITAGLPHNKNYLLALYIDSGSRGKGIGTKLLDRLRVTYRYLTGHVYEQNLKAIEFYKNRGFEVSGKKKCCHTNHIKRKITW